jgi:hypothetical protein
MTQQGYDAAPSHFSVGGVIDASFTLLRRNFWSLFAIAAVIGVPLLALSLLLARLAVSMVPPGTPFAAAGLPGILLTTLVTFVTVLTYFLIQAAVNYGALQDLRGERPAVGRSISRCLAVLPRIAVAVLFLYVAAAVLTFLAVLACYALVFGLSTATGVLGLFRFVPLASVIVMLVLATYWFVGWWVFVPAMVVENVGSVAGFRRSRALTKGHRWGIFGIILLVFIANLACTLAIGFIAQSGIVATATLLNVVFALAFTTLSSVLNAVGYYALRAEKESFGLDDLARIFE